MGDLSFNDLWFFNPEALGGLLIPLLLLWGLLALATGKMADAKGRGQFRWGLGALLLSPLIALPLLLSLRPVKNRQAHNTPLGTEVTRCPTCQEIVSVSLSHCSNCGEELPTKDET